MPAPAQDQSRPRSGALRRTIRDFIDLFLERWWIGAIAGAVAGVLYVVLQPHRVPVYRSDVSLLFETRKDAVLNVQQVVESTVQTASELNTHMEQIKSKTFYDYFSQSFTEEEKAKIQEAYRDPLKPETPPPHIAQIIIPELGVYARKGTSIVGISIVNRSSEMAAFIANRIANLYIRYNIERASSGTNSAIVFLGDQADDILRQMEVAEEQVRSFRLKHTLAPLTGTQNVTTQTGFTLESTRMKLNLDQIGQKNVLDKIEEYQKTGKDLLEIPEIVAIGNIAVLRADLQALRASRVFLDTKYGSAHPKVISNDLQTQEVRKIIDENIGRAITLLRSNHQDSLRLEERYKQEIAVNEQEARKLERISSEHRRLETEAASLRATYQRIIDRKREANIGNQLDKATIKVFDPAFAAGGPINDGVGTVTAKAIGVGTMSLLLIPLMLGFFDTRIRSPQQVEDGLGEPLLGTVKPMPKMSVSERANIYRLQKDPALAESYRGIYSEIEVRSAIAYPKTLLLTSSVPQEGKSQLSCNLAAVFASHKRRTLLVDCDLRRPTLHRYFGLKVETGWVDWIESPVAERKPLPTGIIAMGENFDLLPAGRMPGNPTEILDRLANRAVLEPLLKAYDLIVFDTPPVGIFPDAVLLARCCHEAVFVCRYRTVRLPAACKNIDRLKEAGIVVLGVVLNQLPESKAKAYGYEGYGAQAEGYYRAYSDKEDKK